MIYVILVVVTLCFAYFIKNEQSLRGSVLSRQQLINRVCIVAVFLLLFGLSACRYYVGNDYDRYIELCKSIKAGQYVPTEVGFNVLVWVLLNGFGRDNFLLVFAVFAFVTCLFMLKALYEQSESFFASFALFMLSAYYFQSLNTVRYYLAFAIAMYAMKYVIQKKYVIFILYILAAAAFHKSVLIVIPVYLLANFTFKRWQVITGTVLLTLFVAGESLIQKVLLILYPYYEKEIFGNNEISYVNIIRSAGVFVLCLIYYKQSIAHNKKNRFYFQLNIASLLLYTVVSFLPEISRIGYYMNVSHVFLIPSVISQIENKKQKAFFMTCVSVAFIIYFIMFLQKAGAMDLRILPYQTWLFLP